MNYIYSNQSETEQKCRYESFESIVDEIVTDGINLMELMIASLTCVEYVFLERESLIKSDT